MSYVKPDPDAKVVINREINAIYRAIIAAQEEIERKQERAAELEKLLPYCTCVKCDSELTGDIQGARAMREVALGLGRKDYPCPFCDTPEQTAAITAALDRMEV